MAILFPSPSSQSLVTKVFYQSLHTFQTAKHLVPRYPSGRVTSGVLIWICAQSLCNPPLPIPFSRALFSSHQHAATSPPHANKWHMPTILLGAFKHGQCLIWFQHGFSNQLVKSVHWKCFIAIKTWSVHHLVYTCIHVIWCFIRSYILIKILWSMVKGVDEIHDNFGWCL